MREAGLVLAGCYLAYCWGVLTLYIVSWGILDPERTRFADRVSYALQWPLRPIQAPFVMLCLFLMNMGTVRQRAEAAALVMETQKKQPQKKTYRAPKNKGGYIQ